MPPDLLGLLPVLLSGGAAWVVATTGSRAGRLRTVVHPPSPVGGGRGLAGPVADRPVAPGPAGPGATGRGRTGPPRSAGGGRSLVGSPLAARLACALLGLAAALLLGGLLGAVGGLLAAAAGPRLLRGLEPATRQAERGQLARDLPLALDLLAACLAGGAPVPAALRAVSAALPGPCGDRLARVEAGLAVGTPAAEAWALLAEGEDPRVPVAAPAVRALVRASDGGAPVASAVARLAADARAAARERDRRAARQAGVRAVLPLGLCFLPAFVLLGVVPVVVGLAGPLLRSF